MKKFKVTYYDNVYSSTYTPKIKEYTEYGYSRESVIEVFDHVHQNGEIIKIEEVYQ